MLVQTSPRPGQMTEVRGLEGPTVADMCLGSTTDACDGSREEAGFEEASGVDQGVGDVEVNLEVPDRHCLEELLVSNEQH